MVKHLFKHARRAPGQTTCLLCGCDYYGAHIKPECGLDAMLRAFLCDFASEHGKQWKAKLRAEWDGDNELARRVRNVLGPTGLAKFKLEWID